MIYQPHCKKCGEKYPPASLIIFQNTGQKFCPKCDKEKFSRENPELPKVALKTFWKKGFSVCNKGCGTEVYFDSAHKSENGVSIPLDRHTRRPHDCSKTWNVEGGPGGDTMKYTGKTKETTSTPLTGDKPEPKKEEPKEVDSDSAFDSILKDLSPTEAEFENPAENENADPDALPQPTPDAPLGAQLTMTELDALRYQLMQCWNVPAGAQGAQDLNVEVRITVNPDRTPRNVEIINTSRYNSDPFYRAAADSARRAVLNPSCSPLKLPPEKYDQWKTTIVNFNPSDMF